MTKFNRFNVFLLFTSLFMAYTPVAQADRQQQSYGNPVRENSASSPAASADDALQQTSYGSKIGKKALSGWTNFSLGWLEMPKNIINTINQSNFFYGVVGGGAKGLVNTVGRMGVGVADLLTFPLPTKPIAYPVYIWDDFDVDTTYGEVFRLDKAHKTGQTVIQAPVPQPAPTAVATPPKAAAADRSDQYDQDVNRNLDMLYNKRMQK